ncbi:MAG: alkaline phosphatase [Kiritimatiellae bacterium]|nr:alkaline phosphatase [Kiritimatiellia bacterium]
MKRIIGSMLVAVVGIGCLLTQHVSAETKGGMAKHVVLVGVDGFGYQYIPWNVMPNFSRLCKNGKFTVARNCFPTSSGINWATAFFGTTVEMHGYRKWNSKKPDVPAWKLTAKGKPPCIFSEIRRQDPNAYTASIYNWNGIGFCQETNDMSYVQYYHVGDPAKQDVDAMEDCLRQLDKNPKLIFLYQHQVDCAGHRDGWGSPLFTNACQNVDANLGKVVEKLEKMGAMRDTVVMLIADHGGFGKGHGMDRLDNFEIPFLVYGPVVNTLKLKEATILADTAPTIAWLLGYEIPEGWRGRPALK